MFSKRKLFLCLICVAFVSVFVFSACSKTEKSHKLMIDSFTHMTSTGETCSVKSFAGTKLSKKNELITSSGVISLYFQKDSASVAVKDNNTGKVWYSLPTQEEADADPYVLSLEVYVPLYERIFTINSQRDLDKNVPFETEINNDGIVVTYNFDANIGYSSNLKLSVPVEYSLIDDSLYVSVDFSKVQFTDTAVIVKANLMNYFGSQTDCADGDYMLVPDNCGALIYPAKATEKFKDVSLKVYSDTKVDSAVLGVYGMKQGGDAFVSIIEKGDAIADIKASVAKTSWYNTVGVSFHITETKQTEEKGKQYLYIANESYTGEVKLCYRFLSGNNADYSGMAISSREHLIRTGVLSADSVESSGNLPFVVSAIGYTETEEKNFRTLTTYEQLIDMLTYLKGKGFKEIYVRYKGALTGGTNQNNITAVSYLNQLGKMSELDELKEYMAAQNMKLYIDVDYIVSAFDSVRPSLLARDITGNLITEETENSFGVIEKVNFSAYDKIKDNIISLLEFTKENKISGISIKDSSRILYSDFSSHATREDVKDEIKHQNASLTTVGTLMAQRGNFYTLSNVSVISDIALAASRKNSSSYTQIPFIQLILHGTVDYCSEPINYSADYRTMMLRAVEYGAMPQFEWCYEEVGELYDGDGNETLNRHSYSQWATIAYSFYDKADKALGDIRDKRITKHYRVKKDVYCTEYGDTSIYVNYSDSPVTVSGVTVSARDFVRIN